MATPPGDHRAFLLASDCDNNVSPQTAGVLGGPLVIVQPCPTGDAAACSRDAEELAAWATESLGATNVTILPDELLMDGFEMLFEATS
jgi:hypothetical protein